MQATTSLFHVKLFACASHRVRLPVGAAPFTLFYLSALLHNPVSVACSCFVGVSDAARAFWRMLDVMLIFTCAGETPMCQLLCMLALDSRVGRGAPIRCMLDVMLMFPRTDDLPGVEAWLRTPEAWHARLCVLVAACHPQTLAAQLACRAHCEHVTLQSTGS